jgi:hypothetical protein
MNTYVILIIPHQMFVHRVMLCDNNDTYLPVMFFYCFNMKRLIGIVQCFVMLLLNFAKFIFIYVLLCATGLVCFHMASTIRIMKLSRIQIFVCAFYTYSWEFFYIFPCLCIMKVTARFFFFLVLSYECRHCLSCMIKYLLFQGPWL